jgi:hypothetical protein
MFRQGTFEEIEAQKTIRSKDSFCLKRMPRLEEPMRAGSGVDVRSGALTGGEMQLAGADLLHPEPFRGRVEMTAELCDRVDVG